MKRIRKLFTSIRVKLSLTLCAVVVLTIVLLIILNNTVLEKFYLYNKKSSLKNVRTLIDEYYDVSYDQRKIDAELEKIAAKHNFDILIKNEDGETVYYTDSNFFSEAIQMTTITSQGVRGQYEILEEEENYFIFETTDVDSNTKYILLSSKLKNSYKLYIKMPLSSIEESVQITNKFLYIIAVFIMLFGSIIISFVSRRFSRPIEEMENIAKKISNLDFSQKYIPSESHDEMDGLGESINTLSKKLEITINQLRNTNFELEKDVEEKSKIDEMRKSFISDVSHELKTPIALIQGYSEGLIENVNSDEESRRFYAEVILDEATKMDKLVKQLLELMKLEYGKMNFNNIDFNIVELEKEILRKSKVMIEKENIEVEFDETEPIRVIADDFYIDQVLTNYVTNAIKYSTEINGVKKIKIRNEIRGDKVRVTVFNTLEGLPDEVLNHIWNRFYKADESRNRSKGGNGIGLAIVKAIMNNYNNDFGAKNVAGGVEFYFEIDLEKEA